MNITYIQRFGSRRLALLGVVLVTASSVGCGETGISLPLQPGSVNAVPGVALSGPAGAFLPDPVQVIVLGTDNQPLPGTTVTFAASQGGSVDPATAVTNGNGIASTRWKLGNTAGANVLTATAGSGVSTTISATATAARPASVALVAGNNQTAPAGNAVATAPSVRVTDAFGNLVANATVTFTPLTGGGSVTNGVRTTNAQGVATVGSWVLGPVAGTQTLAARVEESGVSNNPVIFTATATSPAGATMVATAGDNQQASVGRLVPVPPTVVVRNAAGTGVPGVAVDFAVASGGGSVVGSRQITDASGIAIVGGWFLGPLPGTNTLTVTAPGVAPVTFTATGVAGQATAMAAVSQTTQTAPIGTNVSDPPSVIVRDAQGIPVPGVVVTFTVTAGGGTIVGSPVTTDGNGIATLTSWKLGPAVGPNTVTATATGLNSVTFNANGTAGAPATVVAVLGDNQAAVQGTNVAERPTVRVTDASGNPVLGVTVTFSVGQGGGSITAGTQITDAQGQAAVGSWQLGAGATNTLFALVTGSGITGNPVTFTAQSATQIVITSVSPASPNANQLFTVNAQLRNSANAAVSLAGIQLTIAMTSGTGTFTGTTNLFTNLSGAVSFNDLRIGTAGAKTLTITGNGLTSAQTSITIN